MPAQSICLPPVVIGRCIGHQSLIPTKTHAMARKPTLSLEHLASLARKSSRLLCLMRHCFRPKARSRCGHSHLALGQTQKKPPNRQQVQCDVRRALLRPAPSAPRKSVRAGSQSPGAAGAGQGVRDRTQEDRLNVGARLHVAPPALSAISCAAPHRPRRPLRGLKHILHQPVGQRIQSNRDNL